MKPLQLFETHSYIIERITVVSFTEAEVECKRIKKGI